jgi:hypothetical protein
MTLRALSVVLLLLASLHGARGETIGYEIYELQDGDVRKLVSKGVREYSPEEVEVTEHTLGTAHFWSKELRVNSGFSAGATVQRHRNVEGFGLWLKKTDGWIARLAGGGFSWEWFDNESGTVYRKRQGSGRVRVAFAQTSDSEEIAAVEFLEDVTLRVKAQPFFFFSDRVTHQMVIAKGSVLKFSDPSAYLPPVTVSRQALPQTVTFQPTYLDSDRNPVTDASLPEVLSLRMAVIAGDVAGAASTEPVFWFDVRIGESARLRLSQKKTAIDAAAAPLTKAAADAGLAITPADTRIARLATITTSAGDPGKSIGGTGFLGAAAGDALLMVYFDRPCTLSGVARRRGSMVTYNIEIATSGVHLIRLVRDTPSTARAIASPMPEKLFLGITPQQKRK